MSSLQRDSSYVPATHMCVDLGIYIVHLLQTLVYAVDQT